MEMMARSQLPTGDTKAGAGLEETSKPDSQALPARLSEDEVKLYDRQIRLWGFDAQTKLRRSVVKIQGLGLTGQEVAKNLASAGVNLILIDDRPYTPDFQLVVPIRHDGDEPVTKTLEKCTVAEACARSLRQMNEHIRVHVQPASDVYGREDVDSVVAHVWVPGDVDLRAALEAAVDCKQHSLKIAVLPMIGGAKMIIFATHEGSTGPATSKSTCRDCTLQDLLSEPLTGPIAARSAAGKALGRYGTLSGAINGAGVELEIWEAAVCGGVISQQVRRVITDSNDTGDGIKPGNAPVGGASDDWNVAVYDRDLQSVSCYAHFVHRDHPPMPTQGSDEQAATKVTEASTPPTTAAERRDTLAAELVDLDDD